MNGHLGQIPNDERRTQIETDRELPEHLEDTVNAIAQLRINHDLDATGSERIAESALGFLRSPTWVIVLTVAVIAWLAINIALPYYGYSSPDPPPFPLLDDVLTLLALYMASLILMSQNRAGRLAKSRENMTLELAILNEKKASKLIALLEELRRDTPAIRDRVDQEADAMSARDDPHAVLSAIERAQDDESDNADMSSDSAKLR